VEPHDNFYSHVPAGGSYRNGQEDIDGTIVRRSFDGTPDRPTTPFQAAQGHGAFAWNGGEFATDPAKLVSIYFSNLGSFSRGYLRNGYRS
jgi:hypothetical protein